MVDINFIIQVILISEKIAEIESEIFFFLFYLGKVEMMQFICFTA